MIQMMKSRKRSRLTTDTAQKQGLEANQHGVLVRVFTLAIGVKGQMEGFGNQYQRPRHKQGQRRHQRQRGIRERRVLRGLGLRVNRNRFTGRKNRVRLGKWRNGKDIRGRQVGWDEDQHLYRLSFLYLTCGTRMTLVPHLPPCECSYTLNHGTCSHDCC